jgi:hypothetical protein
MAAKARAKMLEARNPKQIQMTQITMFQTGSTRIPSFGNFGFSDSLVISLFRISIFGFRIFCRWRSFDLAQDRPWRDKHS